MDLNIIGVFFIFYAIEAHSSNNQFFKAAVDAHNFPIFIVF